VRPQGHEALQVARGQRLQQHRDAVAPGALGGRQLQVQHLVADGHADAPGLVAALASEAAERQVLDRKVGVGRVGRIDPAAQARVVVASVRT
jgi:hypothetical protein